ncbi:hypothetical protein LDENG_00221760 [Lucifuga dentata]|nr:hypothetical protein LDENG_00221760 [Lucifuga dentata]
MYDTEHGEKKKSRESSEEVRQKIVGKHGQSQAKSISRDLDVPVSTMCNVIKKFKAHGPVANLPGRGRKRKVDQRLQRMVQNKMDCPKVASNESRSKSH